MVKKIYFCLLSLIHVAPALAMSTSDVAALTTQLNHINTQMNAIKRAWNESRIQIKMAEKASSALYNAIKPTFEKLITSSDFIANMDAIVDKQYDEIVNKNSSFKNIKTDNNLSDLFPNLKMSDYGAKLYKALANKAFYVRLGQKLADKVKEITATIKSMQQPMGQSQEFIGQSVM
ncbi:MAG TPA: hypothetical protein VHX42_04915 [Candidatus Babeliales bacterium]|jgi:hypothetical protein|nr:hypothetical protein [Candidatus Babeliales bacterium]